MGPGQPFAGGEGEQAGLIDLHEKRHSLGRESGAGYACGSHLFVNGIQPLALGTDWRQFANVCAWLGACSSLCPGGAGGLIGKPEHVIPDCQSFQAVTWRATFQTISNMNIQGWAYSSSRHWYWLIPHAVFQTLLPQQAPILNMDYPPRERSHRIRKGQHCLGSLEAECLWTSYRML